MDRIPRILSFVCPRIAARPDLWLMGWMGCGLLLPEPHGMLSISQPDYPGGEEIREAGKIDTDKRVIPVHKQRASVKS